MPPPPPSLTDSVLSSFKFLFCRGGLYCANREQNLVLVDSVEPSREEESTGPSLRFFILGPGPVPHSPRAVEHPRNQPLNPVGAEQVPTGYEATGVFGIVARIRNPNQPSTRSPDDKSTNQLLANHIPLAPGERSLFSFS